VLLSFYIHSSCTK